MSGGGGERRAREGEGKQHACANYAQGSPDTMRVVQNAGTRRRTIFFDLKVILLLGVVVILERKSER